MKKILPAIFFALTLLTASAAEPPRLSFDRPSKPGAYFNAEISLTAVREYTIALPGPDKPVERRESLNATLFADIKVLEVNETGAPVRLEIRISSCGGFLNGHRFNSELLNRKTVLADLRGKKTRFTDSATGAELEPSAAALLSAVFRPASNGALKNTLGASAPLTPGDKWKISARPVLDSLHARGLKVEPSSLKAEAVIAGTEKFRGIETCRVKVELSSSDTDAVDFRFQTTIWVPLDPALNVIRTSRNGVEVVDTVLPGDNPLASGSTLRVVTQEVLEAVVVPAEEKTAPKKRSWSDFILR